jgi:hypothetical protein
VSARWVPVTWLLSGLIRAPTWVRVKNAAGIRCTWSKRDGQKHAAHRAERAEGSRGKRLHVCDGQGPNRLEGACRRVSGREEVRRALLGM